MKKIIAVTLALILALSMLGIAAEPAEFKDTYVRSENFDSMAGLLHNLEILDVQNYDGPATRANFGQMLCYAAGLKDYVLDLPDQVFSDVQPEIYYAGELTIIKERGYISGYEDGTFRPNETITLRDAMVCLINALGYRELAMAYGGYPNGYYAVMNNINLKKGISASYNDPISMACAIHLLYNALHTDVFQILGIEGATNKYGTIDGEDLLYTAFQLRRVSGVINSVDVSSLSGESGLPVSYLYIGEKKMYAGNIEVRSKLGSYATAYYYEDGANDTIRYLAVDGSKSSDTVLKVFDITEIADGKITIAQEDGKETKYSYDSRGPVIFNGVSVGSALSLALLSDEQGDLLDGTVTLRDNNGDGKADVIVADVYENMLVGQVDRMNDTVHDYYSYAKSFEVPSNDEEARTEIYATNGAKIKINDLKLKDSIQVYRSKDEAGRPYVRAYVSTTSVSGTIDTITEKSGETVFEIGGIEYGVSNYLLRRLPDPGLGKSVKVTLNYSGKIVDLAYDASAGYQWGMLIAAEKEEGLDEGVKIQMVGTSGVPEVLKAASNITVDGESFKNKGDALVAWLYDASSKLAKFAKMDERAGQCLQVVKYGTNSEGEIKYIDTALDKNGALTSTASMFDKDGDALAPSDVFKDGNEVYFGFIDPSQTNAVYEAGNRDIIMPNLLVGTPSTVFTYPTIEDPNNLEKFTVQDKSFFINDQNYPGIIYFKDNTEKIGANVFMYSHKQNIGSDTYSLYFSLVEKVTSVVNKDGDIMTKLYLYRNGSSETVIGSPDLISAGDGPTRLSDVKPGDLLYYTADSITQEMLAFQMRYIHASRTLCNASVGTSGNNGHGLIPAYIYKTAEDGVQYVQASSPSDIAAQFKAGNYSVFKAGGSPIVLYNAGKAGSTKARQGTYLDLADYVSAGENCSQVLVHIQHAKYQRVFEVFLYY